MQTGMRRGRTTKRESYRDEKAGNDGKGRWKSKAGNRGGTTWNDMEHSGNMIPRHDQAKPDKRQGKDDRWQPQQPKSARVLWDEDEPSPIERINSSRDKKWYDQQETGFAKTKREHGWQDPRDQKGQQESHADRHLERQTKVTSSMGDWKGQEPMRKRDGEKI